MKSLLNQQIESYLSAKIKDHLLLFVAKNNLTENSVLKQCYDKLLQLDINQLKTTFSKQLTTNSLDWPQDENPFDGIYFEIMMDWYYPSMSAEVYGIHSSSLKLQFEAYDIGYDMEISDNLHRFDGVQHDDSPIVQMLKVEEHYEEREALEKGYCLTFYLALHQALQEFVQTTPFFALKRNLPFHFLIGIHDSINIYPLWIED